MRPTDANDLARRARQAGRPRRRAMAAMAAVSGLLLLAGCHMPGTSSSAAVPTASGTITVAASPGVADAPLYIGIKDGLFRQAGLTVHLLSAPTVRSALADLRSGRAQVAFGDYADMFYAQAQKPSLGLVIVADGYDAGPNVMEVLTMPGSAIVTPQELQGKTIGTPPADEMPANQTSTRPYSLETVATWSVLTGDNVKLSDVHWSPMPTSSLLTALRLHQVDAILATEPTIYQAESELGAVPVLDSATGQATNLPIAGYFSDSKFAKRDRAMLTAFQAALLKAQADGSLAAPVQSVLTSYAHLQGQAADLVTVGTYPTTLQASNLQRVANLMFFFSAWPTTTPLTVSSLVFRPPSAG
jgi:NitT/TauT family transport system substrate-binding protein